MFLAMLKLLLPNKSVSIAAPASYWYLKGFPIEAISKIVDYIVFMTYDLHGQVNITISPPWHTVLSTNADRTVGRRQ